MAASGIITHDKIAEDGAVRDFIQKEFEDFGEYLPEFEATFLGVIKNMQASMNKMSMPVDIAGLEKLNVEINKATEADILYEKVQQQKMTTQIKANTLAKSTIDLANKQAKEFDNQTKATARAAAEQQKLNSVYQQSVTRLGELKKQLKDLEVAGQGQAVSTQLVRKEYEELNLKVRAAEQSVGEYQRNVGNYPAQNEKYAVSLNKISKGLRGLGGLGRLLSSALGVDPEVAMGLSEAGRALREIHHVEGLNTAVTTENTVATEANTVATEANVAAKEEESAMSLLAMGAIGLVTVAVIAGAVAIYNYISAKRQKEEVDKIDIEANKDLAKANDDLNKLIEDQTKLLIQLRVIRKQMSKEDADAALIDIERVDKRVDKVKELSKVLLELRKASQIPNSALDANGNAKTFEKKGMGQYLMDAMLNASSGGLTDTNALSSLDVAKRTEYNKKKLELEDKYRQELLQIDKNANLETTIARKKDEEKLNDDAYQDMQSRLHLLKVETADKEKQLKLQLEIDINANSEANKSLQAKADDSKAIYDEYYKAVAQLAFDHYDRMKKIANDTANEQFSENVKAATDKAKDALSDLKENKNKKLENGLYKGALGSINGKFDSEQDAAIAKEKQQEEEANNTITNTEELNAKIAQLQQGLDHQLSDIDRKRYEELFALEDEEKERKKKAHEEEMKRIKEQADAVIDFYAESLKRKDELTKTQLDNDLEARQRNILQQEQLAHEGSANTLAFEKAALEKDELQKEQLAIKQERDAKKIALYKLLASAATSEDPIKALATAFTAMGLAGVVSGSYYEGTKGRNVASDLGKAPRKGKDGYTINVDGDEKIFNPLHSAILGDTPNAEVVDIVRRYQMGYLSGYDTKTALLADTSNNQELLAEIRDLKQVLKDKPVSDIHIDKDGTISRSELIHGLTKVYKFKPNPLA